MVRVIVKINIDADQIKRDTYMNDDFGLFMANAIVRHTNKYVPYLDGPLSKSVFVAPWRVIYDIIYANYQWTGEGFNFTKEKHPLARDHWTEKGYEIDKSTILQEGENYLKGRL